MQSQNALASRSFFVRFVASVSHNIRILLVSLLMLLLLFDLEIIWLCWPVWVAHIVLRFVFVPLFVLRCQTMCTALLLSSFVHYASSNSRAIHWIDFIVLLRATHIWLYMCHLHLSLHVQSFSLYTLLTHTNVLALTDTLHSQLEILATIDNVDKVLIRNAFAQPIFVVVDAARFPLAAMPVLCSIVRDK